MTERSEDWTVGLAQDLQDDELVREFVAARWYGMDAMRNQVSNWSTARMMRSGSRYCAVRYKTPEADQGSASG